MKKLTYLLIPVIVMLIIFGACSKMNDLHDPYLKMGERIYLNKLDTAFIGPGTNRIKLSYLNTDPKAAIIKLYWQSKSDSLLITMDKNSLNDTVSILIPDFAEDTYTFQLVTMDSEKKYKSMPYEVNANVYGEKFANSLGDRSLSLSQYVTSLQELTLKWVRAPKYYIGSEIKYYPRGESTPKVLKISNTDNELKVPDFDIDKDLHIRTVYLPDVAAIDTFYTEFKLIKPLVK